MTPNDRVEIIRTRLQSAFSPIQLNVIDESDQHIGHAGYQGGGRHFSVVIAAGCFAGISRVDAHKKIYELFSDMIPLQIHAMRIQVIIPMDH